MKMTLYCKPTGPTFNPLSTHIVVKHPITQIHSFISETLYGLLKPDRASFVWFETMAQVMTPADTGWWSRYIMQYTKEIQTKIVECVYQQNLLRQCLPHDLLLPVALTNQGDEQVFNVFIFSPDKTRHTITIEKLKAPLEW